MTGNPDIDFSVAMFFLVVYAVLLAMMIALAIFSARYAIAGIRRQARRRK